jgi:hypothetical protein
VAELGFHTPADVDYCRTPANCQLRPLVLDASYTQHPERFVRKRSAPPALSAVAWGLPYDGDQEHPLLSHVGPRLFERNR